ncbi:MAG: hypothetical protein AABW92_04845 [Nanoarchaeota archaeon]
MNNNFNSYVLRRKTVHFTLGILFVVFINSSFINYDTNLVFILLIGVIFSLLASWYIKQKQPKRILSFLALFDKPKDLKNFPAKGAVFYLIGLLAAVVLFDKEITSASILILAVGDPTAHFIANYYGKTKTIINKNKLLEGTLAGTLAGAIAALYFVSLPLAFFGAAFGMMAEAVELEMFNLDDNFFIPFVAGLTMSLIKLLI